MDSPADQAIRTRCLHKPERRLLSLGPVLQAYKLRHLRFDHLTRKRIKIKAYASSRLGTALTLPVRLIRHESSS